jgi:hypothetical protein
LGYSTGETLHSGKRLEQSRAEIPQEINGQIGYRQSKLAEDAMHLNGPARTEMSHSRNRKLATSKELQEKQGVRKLSGGPGRTRTCNQAVMSRRL